MIGAKKLRRALKRARPAGPPEADGRCGAWFNSDHAPCHLPAGHPDAHECSYRPGSDEEAMADPLAARGGGSVTRWGGKESVRAGWLLTNGYRSGR